MRTQVTETEIRKRMYSLFRSVTDYFDVFENKNIFTGPTVYFHHQTLDRLRTLGSPAAAAQDPTFLEYLYATLTAWGLHRLGPKGAKLENFDVFAASLRKCGSELDALAELKIEGVAATDLDSIVRSLWSLIARIKISATESRVVAGSKALHQMLPNLVPPIDRKYTAGFFLWHNQMQYQQEEMFGDVFPRLVKLAKSVSPLVSSYLGRGFNTSLPKLVDNAIVGFMLSEFP